MNNDFVKVPEEDKTLSPGNCFTTGLQLISG